MKTLTRSRIARMLAFLAPALFLSACGSSPEAENQAKGDTVPPVAAPTTLGEEPLPTDSAGSAASLPSTMQGRWGLTANDCDPARSDNKGLMVVSADRLEYYESMGKLDSVLESRNNHIRARFTFSGEGMNWEREMALELQDAGKALLTTQFGEDALPGSLRYTKCS